MLQVSANSVAHVTEGTEGNTYEDSPDQTSHHSYEYYAENLAVADAVCDGADW